MIRAQVRLTADQHARLKQWAEHHKVSTGEAVRRCVDRGLGRMYDDPEWPDRAREALDVVGRYASGRSDAAERRHDEHLSDAFGS